MAVTCVNGAKAVERLGHEQKIPFHLPCFIDAVFPELRRQALREVAPHPVNPLVALLRRSAGRAASFRQPVNRIIGKVLPQLTRGLSLPGDVVVAFEQIIVSVRVVRGFDERVVIAEIQIAHVVPFSEISAIGRDGDLVRVRRRLTIRAGFGKPLRTQTTDRRVRIEAKQIRRALSKYGVGRAMVKRGV